MARGGGSGSAKAPQAGGSKRAVGLAAAANVDPELARLGMHINFVGGSARAKQNVITEAAQAIGSAKAIEKADSRFKVYVHLSGVSKDGSIAWAVLHGDSLKSSPHAARVQGQIYHLARANDSLRAGGAALMAPSAHMVGDVGGDGDPLARPSRTGRNASMMGSLVTAESELTYGEFLDAMSSPLDKVRPPGAEIVALKRALSDSGSGSGSGSHGSGASAAPSKSGKRLTADDLEAVMAAAALADPSSVDAVGAVAEGRAAETAHDLGPSTAVAGAAAVLNGATAAPGGAAAAGSGARAATTAAAGDVNAAGFASLPSFKSTKGKGRKKMYDMPIVESLTRPEIYHPEKDTIDLVSSCLTSTRTPLSTVRLVWSCVLNGVVSRNDTASRYRSSCFPAVWLYVTPPPGSLEPFVGKHWDARVKVPNALLNKTKSKSEQLEPDGHTIATLEECPPASDTYTLMADILAGLLLVCGHDHGATVTAQLTLYRVGVPGLTREMRKAARPATRAKTSSKPITTRQTKLPALAPRSMAGGAGLPFTPAADVSPTKASGAVASDGVVSSPSSGATADKVTPSTSSRGSTTTTAASTESVNDGAVSPTAGQGRRVLMQGRSSARLATAAAARAAGRQASVLRAAQAAAAVVAEPAKTPPTRKRRAAPARPAGKERRVSFAPEAGGAHKSPTFTATPPQSSATHAVGPCELLDRKGRVVAHGSADSGRKVLHNRSVPAHLVVVLVSKCVVSELLYPHEEDFPIEAVYSGPRMMSDAVSCYIVWEASKVRAA